MSLLLIQNYYNEVDKLIQFGGSRKETSIRRAFENLLNEYAKKRNLLLVPELDFKTDKGTTVFPDGTLKDAMRLDWGYWESKDEADDLDKEIQLKFSKGYPNANILFEDSQTAVLVQAGKEVQRVQVRDKEKLDILLMAFVSYERPEIRNFRQAIEQVKNDLPSVSKALRELIQEAKSQAFVQARQNFFELCKQVINPEITFEDINEMLIQHILTEDIFKSIYNESQYHEENNIAQELKKLEITFFKGDAKRDMLDKIRPYYQFIQEHGKSIINHTEKKAFLNAVYEDFYKAYNPKMADKLGVVYTPQEIVKFMIESTEFLLDKHFNLTLSDKNVHILDPATGTGTFVCALIEHLDSKALAYKYEHELFANEVSILPYYIANLNIEYTYRQRTQKNKEFKNLCFVDTLDNISALKYAGKQTDFFGFSTENAERIKRQNEQKISVIIGNPPYNANQQNENDNNKNREYPAIDRRIKETYIKESTAQKTKVYDMYARFYRWATDRLDKNGILTFITNRSFIDSRTFDGFRKSVAKEFNEIYIIDTRSDVRANPKIAGTTHNVFGIQTGVAVMFLVRNEKITHKNDAKIYYVSLPDEMLKRDKLDWFMEHKFQDIDFERSLPDDKGNWINLTDNDFDTLIPVCSKEVKAGKGNTEAIFELFSNGVLTNRDEWVYDIAPTCLEDKVKYFIDIFNKQIDSGKFDDNDLDISIKWSRDLKKFLKRKIKLTYDKAHLHKDIYRPFIALWYYYENNLSDLLTSNHFQMFGEFGQILSNKVIMFSGLSHSKPFQTLATNSIYGLDTLEKTQGLPLYRYDSAGKRVDNITDWALGLFREHYQPVGKTRLHEGKEIRAREIKKEDIFHYVYAVLHSPAYRTQYEQNLKRDFPRVPLYADFWAWAMAGKTLMDLHLAYETAQPYPLVRHDEEEKKGRRAEGQKGRKAEEKNIEGLPMQLSTLSPLNPSTPKSKLKANKEAGEIVIDEQTTLRGVPAVAWDYKLGNRSALEWVLDQYKESTPSDATIAEKFNTYRFADYKEHVIDLLCRVCTVSVETMKVVEGLRG
jgi:predicted helicase